MSTLYLVTIKMDKVTVQGDWKKFSGSEVYFIGKVVDHSTCGSKSFKAGGAAVVDLSATPPFEFLVDDSASIPIELAAWDDGYVWDSQIGKLSATAKAPWSVGPQSTAGPGGLFTLNWSVSKVVAIPAAVGTAWLSKQFDGSQFFNALNAVGFSSPILTGCISPASTTVRSSRPGPPGIRAAKLVTPARTTKAAFSPIASPTGPGSKTLNMLTSRRR
jgi:hypothetical protein